MLHLALLLLLSAVEGDARGEVRSALEEQAPLPTKPLVLPRPSPVPGELKQRAAEAGRVRAAEAMKKRRGRPVDLPSADKEARGNLGQAGQSAKGQARAEEVRKNSKGGKPPPKP